MPRLPQPGQDSGKWGDILNDYLSQIHNQDGTLKDNIVTNAQLATDAVSADSIAAPGEGIDNYVLSYDSGTPSKMAWKPAGGGTNATNLSSTANATTVTIASDTGIDATIATATTTTAGVLTAADKTKLDGVASGATANATDAQLRDRATHTGVQAIATISGLQGALDAKAAVASVYTKTEADARYIRTVNGVGPDAGGNVTVSGGTGVVADGSLTPAKLSLLTGNTANDGNILTYDATAQKFEWIAPPSSIDAYTKTESDANFAGKIHTHTAAQVSDFTEATQDVINTTIKAGTNVTVAYDDAANTFTINSTASGTGAALPGQGAFNVQLSSDGGVTWHWSLTRAEVDTVHTAGVVYWVQDSAGSYPTEADGLMLGDLVDGVLVKSAVIPAASAPAADDKNSVYNDAVILTKTEGIAWVVEGTTHKSSSFTAATKSVPYTGGGTITVTAIPEPGYLISSTATTSYQLTFTNTGGTIYTSEDFNRANAAIGTSAGSFTTNAALGGAAVSGGFATNTGVSIVSNQLGFTGANVGLVIPLGAGTTSCSIEFDAAVLPTNSTDGMQCAVRKSNGTVSLGVRIRGAGTIEYYTYYESGGSSVTQTGTLPTITAGSRVRLDVINGASINASGVTTPDATKSAIRVYVAGTVVSTYTASSLAAFDGAYFGASSGATSYGRFDNAVISIPAGGL